MWLGHNKLSGYAQYRAATFQRLINNIVCDFEVRYEVDPKNFSLLMYTSAPNVVLEGSGFFYSTFLEILEIKEVKFGRPTEPQQFGCSVTRIFLYIC